MNDQGPPPWEMKYTGNRFMVAPVYAPEMQRSAWIPVILLAAIAWMCPAWGGTAWIGTAEESGPVEFAMKDVEAALRARGYTFGAKLEPVVAAPPKVDVRVQFWPRRNGVAEFLAGFHADRKFQLPGTIPAEGFSLRRVRSGDSIQLLVFSSDAAGAMYGGLELAEQIRVNGIEGVTDIDRAPYLPLRGTKFNIPLDLRTPSYSDMGDSAQQNIDTVWDFDFWRAYLDQLARDRYNMVSLWNLHPFPSMVKVRGYPRVALDDVWRSTITFNEDYSTRTTDIVTPAMLAKHEVVRRLTIARKIEFWRRVMAYAKQRNIAIYVFTWNIYTYGVDGKYGITNDLDNTKTIDYFRASVREMFRTYPLLAGIGLTVGENMGDPGPANSGAADAFKRKEDWVFATYGQGILDAARAEPQRRFRLIHRQHESRAQDIAATFAPVIAQPNVDFNFSFKYAQAHALSSTTQTFPRDYLRQLGAVQTFWTIRNDDALLNSWAAPDFVREFIGNIPRAPSQGFYFGSDMWVWGRAAPDPRVPDQPRRLEIENHWLHFLLWGRLGYDPTVDDARIAGVIAQHYPGVAGRTMLAAWQDASMIYPLVTGFHWADFDFQWYIEACRSRPGPAKTASGFHSVETFITQPVHPGTDNIPIATYVGNTARGTMPRGTTPLQVADRIDARADAALAALDSFGDVSQPRWSALEFSRTRNDILSMALLGKYYAAKIRGATELALFRATGIASHQVLAVRHLTQAAEHGGQYAARMKSLRPARIWTNRVGYVDFDEFQREAATDVEIARTATPARVNP